MHDEQDGPAIDWQESENEAAAMRQMENDQKWVCTAPTKDRQQPTLKETNHGIYSN